MRRQSAEQATRHALYELDLTHSGDEAEHAEVAALVATVQAASPPTQVRRPWRSTFRTGVQALVALCVMAPALVDASGLDEAAPPVAGTLAITAGVARVMALPAVEAFLQRFVPWLAAAPRPPEPF